MATIRVSNNPEMLLRAREEIGFSLQMGAEAIGISADLLMKAETGEHQLTLTQLRKASEVYNFPFGYFYFSNLPKQKEFDPVPDYRTDPKYLGINHYRTNLEIKKCRERRVLYLELAENIETEPKEFVTLADSKRSKIGSYIRERLGINSKKISSLRYDQIYSYWKARIEEDGVLVYESSLIPKETGIIGASLFYERCPIILIRRGSDFNQRKLFTLLHEYAHLLLGESALNDNNSLTVTPSVNGEDLEFKCNQLASEILIPSELINLEKYKYLERKEMMEALANEFKVTFSTSAVCLRKHSLISNEDLEYLLELRKQEHLKDSRKNQNKEVKIPREIIMRMDLGKPMFNMVLSAYSAGYLDVYDTSRMLSLRVNKIEKITRGAA